MEIARWYLDAQRSFAALAATFGDDEWATHVPCSPEWTVHDVLSHVAGVTDDVMNRNVEGAATDPWTAAQVERWRDTPRAELIAQWNEQIAPAAEALEAFGEPKPPLDCHTHEHDVRHAIGRPGNRDSEIVHAIVDLFSDGWTGRPIEITFLDGTTLTTAGDGAPRRLSGITRFDLARARLGRRSRRQVESWNWSEPLGDAEFVDWFVFGPSELDIDE